MVIRNPVLPGFHPDPSLLRVGDDYWLATSTFVWQPGIRIFHSRDLTTWELVGHGLTGGVHELRGLDPNGGIWAPDLSFDPASGLFHLAYSYVRSTAAGYFDLDNFVVTAPDVRGPWSVPAYLGSGGFDPSLFHDDDGRHWVVTLEWDPREGYQHPGPVVLEEYDAGARQVVGPTRVISRGSTDRGCLEGPHLYRRDGWYYLMTAEGGTGFGHGVALARSRELTGPYEPSPVNPLLTSWPAPYFGRDDRDHLRPERFNPAAELQKAGHGSLVDTPDGEWYVAHLCARPVGPDHRSVLGRETALQQVEWTDDGWLRLTAGGTLPRLTTPAPRTSSASASPSPSPAPSRPGPLDLRADFEGPGLDRRLSTLRRPASEEWLTVGARPGVLSLRGGEAPSSRFDVSVVATQLQDPTAVARTRVEVDPHHLSHSAGLVVLYDNDNWAYARVYRSESLGSRAVGVVLVRDGAKQELLLHRHAVGDGPVELRVALDVGTLQFGWRGSGDGGWRALGPVVDATYMSDETTRGFTGTMVGLTCTDAYRRGLVASFDHFELRHGSCTDPEEDPA